MLDSAAVGAIIGALARAFPELLKFADRHLDRRHELAMQDKALAFQEKAPGAARKMAEMGVTGAQLQEVFNLQREAWSQQFNTGNPWLNAISIMVRPGTTAVLVAIYTGIKAAQVVAWFMAGAPLAVMAQLYTDNDNAILSGILTFWFMDRAAFKAPK
jgi:hypothetical protein